MFFTVSGGSFGLEGLVGSVGPGVALLLLVATPLVYSVPETLLIGELASMLPVEGGYYQWVKRAFGRFWGFWNGWLSWTYSLLDMAIYPVLLIQYLGFFLPGLGWLERWIVALAMIWGATWLNLRGTRVVGAASGWFVAAAATYPRALARALPLVTLVYFLTIIPVLALTDWTAWTDGAWPGLARSVVGGCLGVWVALAGMLSAFALFNALLLVYSRIPLVLAQDGLLPAALARTDARGTPRNAVLVSAAVYSVFALLPFGGLLAGDVLLYSAALALEFAALVRLRRTEPGLRGAFRVPVGVPLLVTLAALPILLLVAGVALEVQSRTIGLPGVLVALVLAAIGPAVYAALVQQRARRRASAITR